ncbi:YfaP family protein [Shewanella sp.]|uniref:YfaP family protein n=1 Tax=Shewanella sp. TaxID=50422 RepID=UPI003A96F199
MIKYFQAPLCYVLILISFIALPLKAANLCENRGYVLGFFNGVWNDPTVDGALGGLSALKNIVGEEYNDEPVDAELFYNHTGSAVGASWWQDIAETFMQRANEVDESGELSHRFEYLWEVITDGGSFWDRLIDLVPATAGVLDALYAQFMTNITAEIVSWFSDPPTDADYAEHSARLDEFALQGQKLLLVAHSQGNLFVNHAYDYISPKVSPNSVKVVHIAPASPTLRGDYLLADIDVVINALRIQGVSSVPDVNLQLPLSVKDLSGHTLNGTYLDETRAGYQGVTQQLQTSLATLVTPPASVSPGFFTVSLTWDGPGDMDLHLYEPDGGHVFYAAPEGVTGTLDVDNRVGEGPEHYFASCDVNKLQTGRYTVSLNNYDGADGRNAVVQAYFYKTGVLATHEIEVGEARGDEGNTNPEFVMSLDVSLDDNGEYQVSAP